MPTPNTDNTRILAQAGLFQGLGRETVAAAIQLLRPTSFSRGDVIFGEGDPGGGIYIVVRGKVKIVRRSVDGREKLVTLSGPSDMFGELSALDPGPRTSSAVAITDVSAAVLDRASLLSWLSGRPAVSEQLLRVVARRLRRTNDSLADLVFTDVPGRVAKLVLQLAHRFGAPQGGGLLVTHDLKQEEMAQFVGASRETVNKALADFASRGWLSTDHGSVLILDGAALARRAGAANRLPDSSPSPRTNIRSAEPLRSRRSLIRPTPPLANTRTVAATSDSVMNRAPVSR